MLLHSWVTQPIVDKDAVKGIIFESKSGRQAILGKVIIDSTGDGDIFVAAGAEYDSKLDFKYRTAWLAFVFWVTNVNIKKVDKFKTTQPKKFAELMQELTQKGGFPYYFKGVLKNHRNVLWYHCFQPRSDGKSSDAMDVEELTRVEVNARKRALITYEFMKKYVPGFEKSFIMLSAPQLGLQGGRRLIGEYTLTPKDLETDEIFKDTIAVLANNDYGEISGQTSCPLYPLSLPGAA